MEKVPVPLLHRFEERPTTTTMPDGVDVDTEPLAAERLSVLSVRDPSWLYAASKRLLDIVLSLIGIIVLFPVLLIIAVCIKKDDGGPVLHFREIVGRHGERFYALKFRTMIADADGYLEKHPELLKQYQENMKLVRDPRITHTGKFLRKTSLDELPQLFNVLVGQ